YVLNSAHRLIGEVRNLRIETCILRPGVEVPATQLQSQVLGVTRQQLVGKCIRDLVAECDLANLHKSSVFDIHRQTSGETSKPLVGGSRVSQKATIEIVVRQVDTVTTLSPVDKTVEGDRTETEVIDES